MTPLDIALEILNSKQKYLASKYADPTYTEVFPGINYREAGEILIQTDNPTFQSIGYWVIGRSITYNEGQFKGMNKITCFFESLKCDKKFTLAYISLGYYGIRTNRRQLYLKAVEYASPGNFIYTNNDMYAHVLSVLADSVGNTLEKIKLHDGREFCKRELFFEALRLSPNNPDVLMLVAKNLQNDESITCPDGRTLTKIHLLLEALNNGHRAVIYGHIGIFMNDTSTITLPHPDGRVLNKYQFLLESLNILPTFTPIRSMLSQKMTAQTQWTRPSHILYSSNTNMLFTIFLLGLQRLEDTKRIGFAHQMIFEDVLSFWTWNDDKSVSTLSQIIAQNDE